MIESASSDKLDLLRNLRDGQSGGAVKLPDAVFLEDNIWWERWISLSQKRVDKQTMSWAWRLSVFLFRWIPGFLTGYCRHRTRKFILNIYLSQGADPNNSQVMNPWYFFLGFLLFTGLYSQVIDSLEPQFEKMRKYPENDDEIQECELIIHLIGTIIFFAHNSPNEAKEIFDVQTLMQQASNISEEKKHSFELLIQGIDLLINGSQDQWLKMVNNEFDEKNINQPVFYVYLILLTFGYNKNQRLIYFNNELEIINSLITTEFTITNIKFIKLNLFLTVISLPFSYFFYYLYTVGAVIPRRGIDLHFSKGDKFTLLFLIIYGGFNFYFFLRASSGIIFPVIYRLWDFLICLAEFFFLIISLIFRFAR